MASWYSTTTFGKTKKVNSIRAARELTRLILAHEKNLVSSMMMNPIKLNSYLCATSNSHLLRHIIKSFFASMKKICISMVTAIQKMLLCSMYSCKCALIQLATPNNKTLSVKARKRSSIFSVTSSCLSCSIKYGSTLENMEMSPSLQKAV